MFLCWLSQGNMIEEPLLNYFDSSLNCKKHHLCTVSAFSASSQYSNGVTLSPNRVLHVNIFDSNWIYSPRLDIYSSHLTAPWQLIFCPTYRCWRVRSACVATKNGQPDAHGAPTIEIIYTIFFHFIISFRLAVVPCLCIKRIKNITRALISIQKNGA